jgi:hypothetical protein
VRRRKNWGQMGAQRTHGERRRREEVGGGGSGRPAGCVAGGDGRRQNCAVVQSKAGEARAGGVRYGEELWRVGLSEKKENGSAQERSANFHLFQNFQLPRI